MDCEANVGTEVDELVLEWGLGRVSEWKCWRVSLWRSERIEMEGGDVAIFP